MGELPPNCTFYQFRDATIRMTEIRYGSCSYELNSVIQAWDAVGVTLPYLFTYNNPWCTGYINGTMNISNNTNIIGNLVVKSGATVNVTSTLFMGPNSNIIVEPGGKLIVNGGTITSSCDSPWGGIFLGGQSSLPQTEQNQGVVELINAKISNSYYGISMMLPTDFQSTGGIVRVDNSTFVNNGRSIEFLSYNYYDSVNHTYPDNISYVRNSTFTWNDGLLTPHSGHSFIGSHITMWETRGVNIEGCMFDDERTNLSTTNGILTNAAGFNCSNSIFKNLTYGIKGDDANMLACSVTNSDFSSNYCAISSSIAHNLSVNNNTFNITPIRSGGSVIDNHIESEAIGLYVDASHGYNISNNDFYGSSKNDYIVGVQIKNTGKYNTLVNKNKFQRLFAGSQALGFNYGVEVVGGADPFTGETSVNFYDRGLAYRCNSFTDCNSGVYVTNYGSSLPNGDGGINTSQGTYSLPAGNTFTQTNIGIFNRGTNNICYYYDNTNNIPPLYNAGNITISQSSALFVRCGVIGRLTNLGPIELINNPENEEVDVFSIIDSYISEKDFNVAEQILSDIPTNEENINIIADYQQYISLLKEYNTLYNLPDDKLIDLSKRESVIGLKAQNMAYFKGINTDFRPHVIVDQINEEVVNKSSNSTEEYTNILVTPNPAKDVISVFCDLQSESLTSPIIYIYNLQGVLLLNQVLENNTETTINLKNFASGTYNCIIMQNNKVVYTEKLVINK